MVLQYKLEISNSDEACGEVGFVSLFSGTAIQQEDRERIRGATKTAAYNESEIADKALEIPRCG